MVWIPGGTFLMGTNYKESFPNERPARLVQVQGFWMDEHDVTNAEFSKFVEATGYVTTAEREIDWEDLKKEVPLGLVALGTRSKLAPSRRPRELYPGKRESSSRTGLLARRGGLCSVGGQTAAYRSRVGIRGPRRPGIKAVRLG
jgi:formylglycine-generating enzyme required for sulfatase activity